jgi:hypothetical protein
LLKGTLHNIFDNTVREAKVESPALYNMLTTNDDYERDMRIGGLYKGVEVAQGQNIPIQSPVYGSTKEYTQRSWGSGFRMTHRMDRFNKYQLWARWTKDLAKIMKETKDIELAYPFNNLTTAPASYATPLTSFDAFAIAYATHTGLLAGSTDDNYNNYLNADLSVTALESGRYYYNVLKDDMGLYMGANADTLVIEPTLYFKAKQLLGSDYKPFEMSNTVNILPELNLKIFEYHRLTSTTCWFLLAKNNSNYDFNCLTAMEPQMFIKDAPDNTLDRIAISLQYFSYGWGDPRLLYAGHL